MKLAEQFEDYVMNNLGVEQFAIELQKEINLRLNTGHAYVYITPFLSMHVKISFDTINNYEFCCVGRLGYYGTMTTGEISSIAEFLIQISKKDLLKQFYKN